MTTNLPALLPVKMSAAMRRKMREFKGETHLSATTKNGSRNIHPTIKALEVRGLVRIQPLSTIAHRVMVAVLTEQGQAYMAAIVERADALLGQVDDAAPVEPSGAVARRLVSEYGFTAEEANALVVEHAEIVAEGERFGSYPYYVADRIVDAYNAAKKTAEPATVPLDIPVAVRAYIEAEWRGASAAALSAMRGEITAALLAADPELSNTAAGFRFHHLVAEMRDNDSIGADLLAQMEPAPASGPLYIFYIEDEGRGTVRALCTPAGDPVERNRAYRDTDGDEYRITRRQDDKWAIAEDDNMPAVWVEWSGGGMNNGWFPAVSLGLVWSSSNS